MNKASKFLRLALLAILTLSAVAAPAPAQETVPGASQTPIDIRTEDLTFVEGLPALGFGYPTSVKLDVVNNGSPGEFATVRANVPAGAGELNVGGVTYHLLQFHFHTPSEHERDGVKYPMEMHLVHRADDGTLSVVGIFVVAGREHEGLRKLFKELPAAGGERRSVPRFDLTTLLPASHKSFRYTGSLTTPNFDEGVRWVVLAEPIEMSPAQIGAFKALFPDGNSREIQPLNGRTILTDVEPEGN